MYVCICIFLLCSLESCELRRQLDAALYYFFSSGIWKNFILARGGPAIVCASGAESSVGAFGEGRDPAASVNCLSIFFFGLTDLFCALNLDSLRPAFYLSLSLIGWSMQMRKLIVYEYCYLSRLSLRISRIPYRVIKPLLLEEREKRRKNPLQVI